MNTTDTKKQPGFPGSAEYWRRRYRRGETSGPGSYGRLAEFKAEVLNGLMADWRVGTVMEFGCGDGEQLRLGRYPSYIGFDVSAEAIARCASIFSDDPTKTFRLMDEYAGETADCCLSLDVIFHLVEEEVFVAYMERLFDAARKYVVIYSSNTDSQLNVTWWHIKHRRFSDWVERNRPDWVLTRHIPNRYPFAGDWEKQSFADFYLYKKVGLIRRAARLAFGDKHRP